jgi:hypothetical protein
LPLIDIQESASGPELIGGNHGRRFSQSWPNMPTSHEYQLQASIYRHDISNGALWPRRLKSLRRSPQKSAGHQQLNGGTFNLVKITFDPAKRQAALGERG